MKEKVIIISEPSSVEEAKQRQLKELPFKIENPYKNLPIITVRDYWPFPDGKQKRRERRKQKRK